MPSVLIEVRQQYSPEQEVALIEAVHAALREAFKILPHDKNVRLLVHAPHRFACPPERTNPGLYTHISIDAFAGRSLEAKRNLYKALVANLEQLGIPRDHVKILLRELPRENWGLRGGQTGCDIELGFMRSRFSSRHDAVKPADAADLRGAGLTGRLAICECDVGLRATSASPAGR